MAREIMDYDVIIVGAGPAGLSAAIRLKELSIKQQLPLRIAVLEKGATVGAHILSGAVLEPRALNELLPNWQTEEKNIPVREQVTKDSFWLMSKNHHFPLPTPPQMKNQGNYVISLGEFCRFLARKAEQLSVDIFPGFAASDVLLNDAQEVKGILINDVGIDKNGKPKLNFTEGMELHARYTLLAEGARGSVTKIVSEKFHLRQGHDPQTFGLGIKELWEIDPKKHHAGHVLHTIGWPLDPHTYGGSFLYHMADNKLAIGFVVGLDYENTYLDPFKELQRFKLHPHIRPLLEGGRCISYGARALNEGGYQSIPTLVFPGGLLIGCAAGFLNVPKIKGNHTAMKSGMIAAEVVFDAFKNNKGVMLHDYEKAIESSWISEELKLARNIRPGFQYGLWVGLINAALDTYIFRGRAPWTFHNHADNLCLKKARNCKPIHYPKPDGKISFDKLTALQLSNTNHEENQPPHLKLRDPSVAISVNLALYDLPEQRYCPANVYEIIRNEGKDPYLQINAQNCLHCKACDIKDPMQNIDWTPPEGGGGPNYSEM